MTKAVFFRDSAYGQVSSQDATARPDLINYVCVYAGEHTTNASGASEAKTLAGVLSTDIVLACVSFTGTTARKLLKAVPTTNTLTFTFDGNPNTGTAHKVMYAILRAVS